MAYLQSKPLNAQTISGILFLLVSIAFLLSALLGDSMGEGGDSTLHFLYARHAWENPVLFLNHWGKPFFTFIASPFAQFGFTGMKLFNVGCAISAAWLSSQTAKLLNLKYWYWCRLAVLMAPLFYPVMLSGLTEPLSALVLIGSIYLWFKDHKIVSLSLASFLPFIRSEGLVILGVFFVLLWILKQYRLMPWLLLGHAVMSVAGWFYYHEILWVFTKIPYATTHNSYGSGNYSHFIEQLYFCIAPIVFGGFWLGVFFRIRLWLREGRQSNYSELFLIYGISFAFLLAHTLFWAWGIFISMGLNRVLVTIFPLVGIIAWSGFEQLLQRLSAKYQYALEIALAAAMLLFPFIENPASTQFKEHTFIKREHAFIRDSIAPYLRNKYPQQMYFASDPSIAYYTAHNFFNPAEWTYAWHGIPISDLKSGDVVICDPYLMPIECKLSIEQLQDDSSLVQDTIFAFTKKDKLLRYGIFVKE